MKRTLATVVVSLTFSIGTLTPSWGSCLETYYEKMNKVSSNTKDGSAALGACSVMTTILFWPLGVSMLAATGASALNGRMTFNQYVRVKRLIHGAYEQLGMPIPTSNPEIDHTSDNEVKEADERQRKFDKYHKDLVKKTGLSKDDLAKIIVEADKNNLLCPPDKNGIPKAMAVGKVREMIIDGSLQEQLEMPLTVKQEENASIKEYKRNPNIFKQKGKYTRL